MPASAKRINDAALWVVHTDGCVPSKLSTVLPSSNVARLKWCQVTGVAVTGVRVPRGNATSSVCGISSVRPYRAKAVLRQSVALGARRAISISSWFATSMSTRRYNPVIATRCALVAQHVKCVLRQPCVQGLGVGKRAWQRSSRSSHGTNVYRNLLLSTFFPMASLVSQPTPSAQLPKPRHKLSAGLRP